jgi:uncharacterized protein YcbK (DUF882 family)
LGGKASQECAEGQRRALDQEERPKLLRLQEPHQRRPQAQADPLLHRDGCQLLDEVLDKTNTSNEVWADSAYRSVETEAKLKAKDF